MPHNTIYLLDSNVFIQANRQYYAFDLCPGFWKCLVSKATPGQLQSIDRVKAELKHGHDDLWDWAESEVPATFFAPSGDSDVINHYTKIMIWVQGQAQFTPEAKAEFARVADGWLIAYAMAKARVLVTHEAYNPNIRKKVPMPNICKEFGVPYLDTFAMLRQLDAKFDWRQPHH